jgi:hypothetical protein
VAFGSVIGSAQDKSHQPKVVLDPKKPVAGENSFPGMRFGLSCHASGDGNRDLDPPVSIAELIGAPVEVVRIRGYGQRWETFDDVQKHVLSTTFHIFGNVF